MKDKGTWAILVLAVIAVIAMMARAQQPKIEVPIIPDKVALQIRTEQLTQTRAAAEFQQLLQTDIGKRLVALQAQREQSQTKIQTLSTGLCGDGKAWTLDIENMVCVAVKTEAAKVGQ